MMNRAHSKRHTNTRYAAEPALLEIVVGGQVAKALDQELLKRSLDF